MVVYNQLLVGIFSREAPETLGWVVELLRSPRFRRLVADIRPVSITNDVCGGSRSLQEEITKCSFAILYHSQSRGRLNLTDVTDSLYDQELQDLSTTLGRERVLVLVDDVEDHPETVHSRISSEQPLIRELAALLVVFSKSEKPLPIGGVGGSYQRRADHMTHQKIESIRSQIRKGQTLRKTSLLLIGCAVAGIVLIIVLCVELID